MIALLRHSWQPLNLEYQRTHNAWHFADQRVNTRRTGGLVGFRFQRSVKLFPGARLNVRGVSCVDGPRLARDHLACRTEVACSHVSGLFTQSGWTAGPDGVREPRPHHSSGIDVPMNRQASLGCVGSTDCAITRHFSLASSSPSAVGDHSPGLVFLLAQHHRPGDARRLVRQRHRYDQRPPPPTQPDHPWIGFGRLRSQQIGACPVDEQPAQIAKLVTKPEVRRSGVVAMIGIVDVPATNALVT
jgi:hypothetical protein